MFLTVVGFGESFTMAPSSYLTSALKRGSCILQARTNSGSIRHGHKQTKQRNQKQSTPVPKRAPRNVNARSRRETTQQTSTPKRVPRNKRTAIRWVVQGVERALSDKESARDGNNGGNSYKRRIDASLVDALYLMVNANSQKDVLDSEERVGVLMRHPNKFPAEVNERVIKATAMAGLSSLSLSLLRALLEDESRDALPSPMAYTAVLNALRKNGRIDRLEGTLAELAAACRRMSSRTGKKVRVDVVAFNVLLAALCDAAVKGRQFPSSAPGIATDEGLHFNFTSMASNASSGGYPTMETPSSEKYLYKALNLLKGDVARTRFALAGDPDGYSYNSVLDAVARCSKPSFDGEDHCTRSMMTSCLREMKGRRIKPDALTYNAQIRGALARQDEEAAIELIDEVILDPSSELDRFTINFALAPFLRAGRRDDLWLLLREFYHKNVAGSGKNNNRVVSSAFEAFLNTIVQDTGDVNFADEVFREFFLPTPVKSARTDKRIQVSQMVHVLEEDAIVPSLTYRRYAEKSNCPAPSTRHFNILFAGYSKAHLSAVSRLGKHRSLIPPKYSYDPSEDLSNNATLNDLANDNMSDNRTSDAVRNAQKAYKLLDAMLGLSLPLDAFSVTSLMALPFTAENVTSLLERIEPEMMVELNPAAYRSIITAYGRAGDPSSACWVFEEAISRGNQGRNVENWNVLLGALSKGCVIGATKNNSKSALDILNSSAAQSHRNPPDRMNDESTENQIISKINGMSPLDASLAVLDAMRNGTGPRPNSQSYCLVASALSGYGTAVRPDAARALRLFRNATSEGVAADGRFLNAVLRCHCDDVEGALALWKSDVGPAAAARVDGSKARTDLIAAYNGLMHVCGRALRPDVATRIAYAMKKAGIEPTEVTLNSYFAGKREALAGGEGDSSAAVRKKLRLADQYETLLSVECTKYNVGDKRRSKDKKIRIILSN